MPLSLAGPVHSARLTIRPIDDADLADLLEINGDPQVTVFLPYETWASLDDGRAWLQRMRDLESATTGRQFVLELRAARKVVGTLLVFRYDEKSARVEIGYVIGRAYWRQGLMREALDTFCRHALGAGGLRRIEAEVDPANVASNAVLRQAGFVQEGRLRQRWAGKRDAYDTLFYGLLAQDLPA
jgi:RimJ/RimL family protein N-acetyltransferase